MYMNDRPIYPQFSIRQSITNYLVVRKPIPQILVLALREAKDVGRLIEGTDAAYCVYELVSLSASPSYHIMTPIRQSREVV
jgi:hypothetical protein